MQESVLNILLDMYEKSATYKGKNLRNQSFMIKPEKVFPDYDGDYTDTDDVDQFNRDMELLFDSNFIMINYVKGLPVIASIKLNTDVISDIYKVLKRQDVTKRRVSEIELYSEYLGIHSIIDSFCKEQIIRLSNYKDAKYSFEVATNILKLLKFILNNHCDIMDRELSIAVLRNSKLFENSYRSRVCKIIEQYGDFCIDFSIFTEREKEKVILEEFQVFSNPSYIFLKGNIEIYYRDGNIILIKPNNPIAIFSETICEIENIKINSNKIITVENLTSFNRMNDRESTFIYLSGYHNTAKQNFLKKVAEYNKDIAWHHFGDIDPDGYYILKNLVNKTGISFLPLYMGIEQLVNFTPYTKKLEKNDIVKAQSLIKDDFYGEVMDYMLKNDCKLEQEVISWIK